MKAIPCPSCGAPIALKKGISSQKCSFCENIFQTDYTQVPEFEGLDSKQYKKLKRRAYDSLERNLISKAYKQFDALAQLLETKISEEYLDIKARTYSIKIKEILHEAYNTTDGTTILSVQNEAKNALISDPQYYYTRIDAPMVDLIDEIEDKCETLNREYAIFLARKSFEYISCELENYLIKGTEFILENASFSVKEEYSDFGSKTYYFAESGPVYLCIQIRCELYSMLMKYLEIIDIDESADNPLTSLEVLSSAKNNVIKDINLGNINLSRRHGIYSYKDIADQNSVREFIRSIQKLEEKLKPYLEEKERIEKEEERKRIAEEERIREHENLISSQKAKKEREEREKWLLSPDYALHKKRKTKNFILSLTSIVIVFISLGIGNLIVIKNNNENKGWISGNNNTFFDDTVTVGILHSLSGTMAISESTLVDVEKMAIEEINASGGVKVNGKRYKIEYIVEDGQSSWPTFAEKSKKLIDRDGVPVVFGGWTSASRKAMLPVFEYKDAFLFYPIQYEAQECSNNIFYTGATPNQQSEPATDFMYKRSPAAGGDFFLIGSDFVFPRTSNTITKTQVRQLGGRVVGEDYLPLGNTEVAPIIWKIKKALPRGGIIINTLNGDQNVAFFKQIQDAGITPSNGYYVMNYSIAEEEISTIGPEFLEGHYGAWNYMMSIDTPASKKFAASFKKRWGADRVVADPQESAYNMVYLWKQAVEDAGTFDDNAVREALVGQKFDAPQGPVEVMPNHHLSQTVRIGEINAEGGFTIIEETGVVLPQAWNQKHPSSKGFGCDWTDPSKGEKYRF